MKSKQRVIYYRDEQNDEFAGDDITPKKIDGSYRYLREDLPGRAAHVLCYHVLAIPLAFFYMKLYFGHRVVNREILRKAEPGAFFLYGNHTHPIADALIPTMVSMPKEVSVIVHPNNVSMPVLGRITPSLGALPLPDDREAAKHFLQAITTRVRQGSCIMIYPEAHIWPYYTKIRPFPDTSFRYPVQYRTPVYCLTNTYQKRRYGSRPRLVTYLDGPFFPDETLPAAQQKKQLRNQVYEAMTARAKNSNLEVIRYEKEKEEDTAG